MAELILATQTTPAAPSAGNVGIFVDSADGATKQISSGGTVTSLVGATSVFGRTGDVVAGNADYLAVATGGLTGATAATRYVGATASGAPVSGTFAVGDMCVGQDGTLRICTTAGSPGTWTAVGGTTVAAPIALGIPGSSQVALGSTNAYAIVLYAPAAFTVTKVGYGSSTNSGNMLLGVYNAAGTALSREASFAMAGPQLKTLTASASVPAGGFYLVIQLDNGTGTIAVNNVAGQTVGLSYHFANTFGSGLPATLPALTNETAYVALVAAA